MAKIGLRLTPPRDTQGNSHEIGLFDHVEKTDRPLHTLFDERLRFAAAADAAGFYCLHVAEHHASPLNMVPAPSVYLAAVARDAAPVGAVIRRTLASFSRFSGAIKNTIIGTSTPDRLFLRDG
jgi:hypothetical protein